MGGLVPNASSDRAGPAGRLAGGTTPATANVTPDGEDVSAIPSRQGRRPYPSLDGVISRCEPPGSGCRPDHALVHRTDGLLTPLKYVATTFLRGPLLPGPEGGSGRS